MAYFICKKSPEEDEDAQEEEDTQENDDRIEQQKSVSEKHALRLIELLEKISHR